jgi:hypothetical protein
MADQDDDTKRPMAEPGKPRSGASTGGVLRNADAGLRDAYQRSTERGADDATGAATTGDAASGGAGPRLDLGVERKTPTPTDTDDTDTVAPDGSAAASPERTDEPPDEGPIESLGRAISAPLTGSEEAEADRRGPPSGRR